MANLTQAQVAAILAQFPQYAGGGTNSYWTDPTGNVWNTAYNAGTSAASLETGTGSDSPVTNIFRDVNPGHHDVGDQVEQYSPSGSYLGTAAIPRDSTMQQFLTAAAIMAGPMLATAAGAGAAAGGGYGAVGGGAEGYAGLDAGSASSLGGGASINGGAALGTGAGYGTAGGTVADLAGAGGDGTGSGGYGMDGGTNMPWESDFQGTGAISGADAIPGAGTVDLGSITSGNGNWLSSLIDSVGGSNSGYGRILTSLLGGALGSHGTQTTTSTQRTIDPRMVPYVYGDGTANNPGILGYTSGLLHSQMQPGALQGYTDMQNVGRGLLNQPVAGNGFNRFFGSR